MKKKKEMIILTIGILLVITSIPIVKYLGFKSDVVIDDTTSNEETKQITGYNAISFMLETEYGSGVYEESTSSEWSSDGYTFNSSLSGCENGGTLTWDDDTGTVTLSTSSSDRCYVYLDMEVLKLAEYIVSLAESDTTNLATDDPDGNVRYIGTNPDNYIDIGDSVLWRIIGTFEITAEDGNTETLVKIIRSSSIGSYYWNSGGTNNWPDASLNTYLNGTYLSSLDSTTQSYFESVVWNLGGVDSSYSSYTAENWYNLERGTTVYSGNDTTWTGTLALMYVSDYGYATTGYDASIGSSCVFGEPMADYDSGGCHEYDWLYLEIAEWFLTTSSSTASDAYLVNKDGEVTDYDYDVGVDELELSVRPTGYLMSALTISGGDGSSSLPYVLSFDKAYSHGDSSNAGAGESAE